MKSYVAGFCFSRYETSVVMVKKARPDWQAGKLNGVGGKVEPGETPVQAMVREFKEETGLKVSGWELFALLQGRDQAGDPWQVWWYRASCGLEPREAQLVPESSEEPVGWYWTNHVTHRAFTCIPNVPWLLDMANRESRHDWPYYVKEVADVCHE